MDPGKPRSSSEEEAHRPSKQQRTSHAPSRGSERGDVQLPEPQAWLPTPMLGGEPLTYDASIRDFNGGIGCHVVSVLEETLLLPRDMVELRGFKRSKVFLHTKRFLGMVRIYFFTMFFLLDTTLILFFFFFIFIFLKAVQSTFRLEEMFHSLSQQLDDKKKWRVAAVQTLTIAENNNADLRKKLTAEEQARKSIDAALKGAEKQAKSQRKLTNEAKEQLAASKE